METILKNQIQNFSSARITENKFADYVLFSLSATMNKSTKFEDDNHYIFREAKYRKQQQMNFKFDQRNGSYYTQFKAQMQSTKVSKKRTLLQIEKSELQIQFNEKGQNVQVFKAFDQKNNVYVVLKIPRFIIKNLNSEQPIAEELQARAKDYAKTRYLQQLIAKQLSHYFNQQCYQNKGNFFPIYYATPYLYKFDIPFFGTKIIYGESYIDLEIPWQKYSNNGSFYLEQYNFTTFSHFTYVKTNKNMIITDLQGKQNLFSDPSIHSKDIEDEGNCREEGYMNFFKFQHAQCTTLCQKLNLPIDQIQKNEQSQTKLKPIIDEFGGYMDKSNLYKICQNCNAQEKLDSIENYKETCKECLEKQLYQEEFQCECCKVTFKRSSNYEQILDTIMNLCPNCHQSKCRMGDWCYYCKGQICQQTVKIIQIDKKSYLICLDAFHYLRQMKCLNCFKDYKFQKLLTSDEYCNNQYTCDDCLSRQQN
ncbi:unnamed protein product [Paramecium sonneborni]|uniref:Alpha-type protein kinase domain-containing protein n=1 Tax=Paramecium sonneborni TaxID=65129 RepID=A0A8S1MKH3_9CILI|nr:unnamed protein product [Paramecium sonneborni]